MTVLEMCYINYGKSTEWISMWLLKNAADSYVQCGISFKKLINGKVTVRDGE